MHRFVRTIVTLAALILALGLGSAAGAQTATVPTAPQGGNPDVSVQQNTGAGASTPTDPVRGITDDQQFDDGDDGGSALPWILVAIAVVAIVGGVAAVTRRRSADRARI